MPAQARAAAVLALLLNAFTWGLSWWPLRRLQAAGVHPLWATVLVYVVALAVLLAWRPGALAHALRAPSLWWLVLASGATNAAFNWGMAIGDVVRVVLLFYLMPLWAVLLARLPVRGWRSLCPDQARTRPTFANATEISVAFDEIGRVLELGARTHGRSEPRGVTRLRRGRACRC